MKRIRTISRSDADEIRKAAVDMVGYVLPIAESGQAWAVSEVWRLFCSSIEQGDQPDARVLRYLQKCGEHIVDGASPNTAFRWKGKPHRQASQKVYEANLDLARRVVRRMIHASETKETAIARVDADTGYGESRIKKAYEAHNKIARLIETQPT